MTASGEFPEIPQRELRNHASRVLRDVRQGSSFVITVDGVAVADLVPHRHSSRRVAVPKEEVVEAFRGLTPIAAEGEQAVDDSLYDPYDRAWRRGEFTGEG